MGKTSLYDGNPSVKLFVNVPSVELFVNVVNVGDPSVENVVNVVVNVVPRRKLLFN